jgi:hypothetical protein
MGGESCSHCGSELPPKAKVCPECGSDENTGWSDEAYASSLNLPSDDFNYDEFVKNEFADRPKPQGISWLWWGVALILVLLFLFAWIF